MRLDDAGPRTWLLAALAGGALVFWLLALGGMGGRIVPLPDAAPGQRLPQPTAVTVERLGPLSQYAQIGTRPLFSQDRKPQPFSLSAGNEQAQDQRFDYMLTGVLLTPGLRMAIVQPNGGGKSTRLKLGQGPEASPAWRLVGVHARSAVFEGPEGQRVLDLRSYDGVGGSAPTARQPDAVGTEAATHRVDADPAPGAPTTALEAGTPPAKPEPAAEDTPTTPQEQMEMIRQRIEARREQLRREAQQPQPPAQTR